MRPRLLFLSQCLPYPPHSGVTNRTYHILRALAASFDVTLLAFSRTNHQPGAEDVRRACSALESLGVRVAGTFRIRSEQAFPSRLLVHLRSLASGRAYTFFDYDNRAFPSVLRRVLREQRPEIVHVDSLDLHRWLPLLGDLPVACTHHSIESDLLRLRAQHAGSGLTKMYMRRQADAILSLEKEVCPRLRLNVMMSELDAERLTVIAPSAPTFVAPNGVDVGFFEPRPGAPVRPGRVLFLGPSYMLPNYDGVQFFLKEVWGAIRADQPEATFQIVGKVKPTHRATFESYPGVSCAGFVDDVRPYLAEAACCVVPLRIGGGTRLKILDTWAMGRPVVSTSVGCEGLAGRDGVNILIRDEPRVFAKAVLQVLADEDLQHALGSAGRRTAESQYSWDSIGSSLTKAYGDVMGPSGKYRSREVH